MGIKVVASEIFFSKLFPFVFIALNFVFLTTSLSTASFNFFESLRTIFNLPTSKSSTFVFKLFKLVGTFTTLLMSSLSTSAFKIIKHF